MYATLRVNLTTINGEVEEISASQISYSRRQNGDAIVISVDSDGGEAPVPTTERTFNLADLLVLKATADY